MKLLPKQSKSKDTIRPEMVLCDFEKQTMFVIEFLEPADENITGKEKGNKERYKGLIRDLRWLYLEFFVKRIFLITDALRRA